MPQDARCATFQGRGEGPPSKSHHPGHAQNLRMADALTKRGYNLNYTWGIGTHSGRQGGAMMPEMLRWLWRDYPRPDDPANDGNRKLFVPLESK